MALRSLVQTCCCRHNVVLAVCGCLLTVTLAGCSYNSKQTAAPRKLVATTIVSPAIVPSQTSIAGQSVKSRRPDTRTPTPNVTQVVPAAQIAGGKVIVQAQCAWCHALADAGVVAATEPVAPALDGIGAAHGRAWLSAVLIDACRARPTGKGAGCTRAHGTVAALSLQQREQIVSYLLTLR